MWVVKGPDRKETREKEKLFFFSSIGRKKLSVSLLSIFSVFIQFKFLHLLGKWRCCLQILTEYLNWQSVNTIFTIKFCTLKKLFDFSIKQRRWTYEMHYLFTLCFSEIYLWVYFSSCCFTVLCLPLFLKTAYSKDNSLWVQVSPNFKKNLSKISSPQCPSNYFDQIDISWTLIRWLSYWFWVFHWTISFLIFPSQVQFWARVLTFGH